MFACACVRVCGGCSQSNVGVQGFAKSSRQCLQKFAVKFVMMASYRLVALLKPV